MAPKDQTEILIDMSQKLGTLIGHVETLNNRMEKGDQKFDSIQKLLHSRPCLQSKGGCKEQDISNDDIPLNVPHRWKKVASYIFYAALAASAFFFGVLEYFTKASENEKPKITLIKGEKDK